MDVANVRATLKMDLSYRVKPGVSAPVCLARSYHTFDRFFVNTKFLLKSDFINLVIEFVKGRKMT